MVSDFWLRDKLYRRAVIGNARRASILTDLWSIILNVDTSIAEMKTSNHLKNKIGISMITNHDPYKNSVVERSNGTLKNEFDLWDRLPDRKNAEMEMNKAFWIYNNLKPYEIFN